MAFYFFDCPVKMLVVLRNSLGGTMQKHRGFNLIELMIAVTIIGILASVAVPAYQHYVKKARAANIISAVAGYKTAIEVAIETGAASTVADLIANKVGIPPNLDAATGARFYLTSLTVENGTIKATGNRLVGDVVYELAIKTDDNKKIVSPILWVASGTCVTKGLCQLDQNVVEIAK